MSDPDPIHYRNELLRRLAPEDLALLEPNMTRVQLALRENLHHARSPVPFVYFMEAGIASTVASIGKGRDAEVAVIGHEGMAGSGLVLGDDCSPHETYIQLAGEAIRIPAEAFSAALLQSPTLRPFLLRYVQCLNIQTAFTATVNVRSKLEERLARWLLMCDVRVPGESLPITHEFLGVMLGVRRPGVTVTVHVLEGKGLIRGNRAEIVIRDRKGLIKWADGSYGAPEAEYERLIGKIS